MFFLGGATSHLTAYPCKSTSPSEVMSKLHDGHFPNEPGGDLCRDGFAPSSWHTDMKEWIMWRDFRQDRTSLAKSSWDGCTIVQEVSLGTRGYSIQISGPHHSVTGKTPLKLNMGRRPRDLSWTQLPWIQNSWHQHQPNKTFLMKKFKKLAMKTHLEVQQRERHPPRSCWTDEVCSSRFSSRWKVCCIGKRIRAKFRKDGSLGEGWRLKFLLSKVQWLLSVLVRPFFK